MLSKALLVLTLLFVTLGAARWAFLRPFPPWLLPALAGIAVYLVTYRWGAIGVLAALAAAGLAAWFRPIGVRPGHQPPTPAVSLEEARAILGVGPAATVAEIRAAHRAHMRNAHPDLGGNARDASRLNVARDVLVNASRRT